MSEPVAFERPVTRDRELAGQPGVVRFLDLPMRRFVMVDGDGQAVETAYAPRMPGSYAAERPTIELLHAAIAAAGLRPRGRHREIYLGDPRRGDPAKVRTLLRQPVE